MTEFKRGDLATLEVRVVRKVNTKGRHNHKDWQHYQVEHSNNGVYSKLTTVPHSSLTPIEKDPTDD